MAYTKNTWNTGDIVSSQKLNHMEDGIANAGALVVTENDTVLDKTWQEILDAIAAGRVVNIIEVGEGYATVVSPVSSASLEENNYMVYTPDETVSYKAASANGYPTLLSAG